jgi:hypothetical protein
MKWFAIILIIVLFSQVILYVYGRRYRKSLKNSVIEKYNLKTPKDAWNALADPNLPEADRAEIKKLYEGRE